MMRRIYRVLAALVIPAASLAFALLTVAGLVLIIGEEPGRALITLVRGALGDSEGIGYTLFYATNFVFARLAVALPFQVGLFNVGGEGQAALSPPPGHKAALCCARRERRIVLYSRSLSVDGAGRRLSARHGRQPRLPGRSRPRSLASGGRGRCSPPVCCSPPAKLCRPVCKGRRCPASAWCRYR